MRLTLLFAILYFAFLGYMGWQESTIISQGLVNEYAEIQKDFILELEFLEDDGETVDLFQSFKEPISQAIGVLEYLVKIDFIFLFIYPLFFFLFGKHFCRWNSSELWIAGGLCVLIGIMDAFENIQILGILENYKNTDFSSFLPSLRGFTWLKWGALSTVLLLYVKPFWGRDKLFLKFVAVLLIVSFLIGVFAVFGVGSPIIYGYSVGVCSFLPVYISVRENIRLFISN